MTAPTAASSDNSSLVSLIMKCNTGMSFVKMQMHKFKHWMGVGKHMQEMEVEG